MDFSECEVIGNEPGSRWNDLLAAVQVLELRGSQWIFRALTGWEHTPASPHSVSVMSSFDDAWRRRVAPTKSGDRALYESWILADFKREAHNYLSHLPEPGNFLEWMALGRHFGMPTRLTDFTTAVQVSRDPARRPCDFLGNWTRSAEDRIRLAGPAVPISQGPAPPAWR